MGKTINSPADDAVPITPNNDNNFAEGPCRSIYVGGGGNVEVVTMAGQTVTFANVADGDVIPIRARRVRVANTTATLMLALY